MGYFKKTLEGITWMTLLRGLTRSIGLFRIIILARLLTPNEFGIFGIAALMLAFFEVITETGVNVVLVQEKENIKEYINTAWVVSILRGLIISLLIFIGSGPISTFFSSPNSLYILRIISIVPLLRGFINPTVIKFQKELNFKNEFFYNISYYLVDAVIVIIVAFQTHSAISFVWGLLAGVVFELFISHLFVSPKPKLIFEKSKIKKILNRGKWMTFAGLFNYVFHEGDDWVVGKLLNTTSLGLYQVAYKISGLPVYEVGQIVNRVTFPIYSKIKDDTFRLKKAFFKVLFTVSLFVIPFGIILLTFTKPLVLLILGENWLSIVPVIKILSVFGVLRAITGSAYSLYLGVNKQEYATAVTGVSTFGLLISIYPLVTNYGITGAGISALIGTLISTPLFIYYSYKIFKND